MYKYLPFLLVLLLASCRTSDKAQKSSGKLTETEQLEAMQAEAYVKKVHTNAQTAETLTARIKMTLNAEGQELSVNGTLRMKRDDVIQLSLTFLGMEVARMEFSPKDVLIIDRFNKQYVRATYSDVSFLKQANLDFKTLQSLFWSELFIPGGSAEKEANRFRLSSAGTHTLLTLRDTPKLEYAFLCTTETADIKRVTVQSQDYSKAGKFEWRYADHTTVSGKPFPGKMSCSITGLGKDAGFSISLEKIDHDTDWKTHTTPSKKYTRRNADELLGKLLSL